MKQKMRTTPKVSHWRLESLRMPPRIWPLSLGEIMGEPRDMEGMPKRTAIGDGRLEEGGGIQAEGEAREDGRARGRVLEWCRVWWFVWCFRTMFLWSHTRKDPFLPQRRSLQGPKAD